MKIATLIFADFEETFWGGPSRLQEPLRGQTVLGHTLRRAARLTLEQPAALVVQPRDAYTAQRAAEAAGVAARVVVADMGVRARREMTRAARKWNATGWRGGLANATWFDEYIEPALVLRALDSLHVDAALCLDGHQSAFDVSLAERMIVQMTEGRGAIRFVFSAAPPGLAGVVLHRTALLELAPSHLPFGIMVSYRPEFPAPDPLIHATCCRIPPAVAHTAARFSADTVRGQALLEEAMGACGDDADAEALCRWAADGAGRASGDDRLPAEVEIELTTADPTPATRLRPRGERAPVRELTEFAALEARLREFAERELGRVVLAGHGDPLLHPQFERLLEIIQSCGVGTVAIETALLDVSAERLAALIDRRVDVVLVHQDAISAEAYAALHGVDRFAEMRRNLEQLENERRRRALATPLCVPSLTKCAANLHEMSAFFDESIRQFGSAVIRGYNEHCGLLPADSTLHAGSPTRRPCRRLTSRLLLLADGTVPMCGQDVRGAHAIADWRTESMPQIWGSAGLQRLRALHAGAGWDRHPLCARCNEWFRP